MKGYLGNIEEETLTNTNFRKVLFTGPHSQLVVMSLKPGEDIGLEAHHGHDQFIRVDQGHAKFIVGDDELEGGDGFAVVIPSGAKHNVINIGNEDLKLYTIYAPPEHPNGTIHRTKSEAEKSESH